jgi:hypothetical protein
MCKGEAHGDFERQTMLADSKCLNSTFAISSFSGSRQRDFAKTAGWLPVPIPQLRMILKINQKYF